jgi:hypothetical protein
VQEWKTKEKVVATTTLGYIGRCHTTVVRPTRIVSRSTTLAAATEIDKDDIRDNPLQW